MNCAGKMCCCFVSCQQSYQNLCCATGVIYWISKCKDWEDPCNNRDCSKCGLSFICVMVSYRIWMGSTPGSGIVERKSRRVSDYELKNNQSNFTKMENLSEQNKPARPNSYLALAIVSTILCCLPLGIVSIIYATKVNSSYEDGKYEVANQASKNAKTWGLFTIREAALGWIIYVLIFGFAFLGALASG